VSSSSIAEKHSGRRPGTSLLKPLTPRVAVARAALPARTRVLVPGPDTSYTVTLIVQIQLRLTPGTISVLSWHLTTADTGLLPHESVVHTWGTSHGSCDRRCVFFLIAVSSHCQRWVVVSAYKWSRESSACLGRNSLGRGFK